MMKKHGYSSSGMLLEIDIKLRRSHNYQLLDFKFGVDDNVPWYANHV
jgi:hypothetical protein